VLVAVTTGMHAAAVLGLCWSDVMYSEGLLAVRAKLKWKDAVRPDAC
jgi:hypothetical protein